MKNVRTWTLCFLFAICCLTESFPAAADHKVLFEKARYVMETQGDLKQAISLFSDIIKKYPKEREYAAKSQYFIGICYEKMGTSEAQKAFQSVVDKYSDQQEVVRLAREKLSTLNQISEGISIKQIWADDYSDTMGKISPDGRFLSFTFWENGDLGVRDLSTGINRRLTQLGPNKNLEEEAFSSCWSPDGRRIAYIWFRKSGRELRIFDLETNTFRTVTNDHSLGNWVKDWSRDGKEIALDLWGNTRAYGIVNVENGEIRTVTTTHRTSAPINFGFSPDGKFLAFDAPSKQGNIDVFMINLATGEEAAVVEHPAADYFIGWAPGRNQLLFQSNRMGSFSVWSVTIEEGKAVEPPVLIKPAFGNMFPLGITSKGALIYSPNSGGTDVYLAEMDFASGKVVSNRKLDDSEEGKNYICAFSPDGKSLAHIAARGAEPGNASVANTLCIHSLTDGKYREYKIDLNVATFYRPQWSTDSQAIFFSAADPKISNTTGLYKLDIGTGAIQNTTEKGSSIRAADGSFVISTAGPKSTQLRIKNIATGEEKELRRFDSIATGISLSPDQRLIGLMANSVLEVFSVLDGGPIVSSKITDKDHVISFAWTADSRNLLLTKSSENDSLRELWLMPLYGGSSRSLGLKMQGLNSVVAHPDGHQIAFTAGQIARKTEIWSMENFLPVQQRK